MWGDRLYGRCRRRSVWALLKARMEHFMFVDATPLLVMSLGCRLGVRMVDRVQVRTHEPLGFCMMEMIVLNSQQGHHQQATPTVSTSLT